MNLKKIRINNNLTQKDIANALNIKRSTYAGWELGTNTIPLRNLLKISNYYKVSIDYITNISKYNEYNFISDKIDLLIIGKNLKTIRKKNKLTQQQIAFFLKISVSSYTLYELGKILIPTIHIIKLAKKYKFSIDKIIKCRFTDED